MPYIKPDKREQLDPHINKLFAEIETKGEINYCITKLVHLWIEELISRAGKKSYDLLSLGHNVLQDAVAEYYRRVMGPYEDGKQIINGPISKLDIRR